MTFSVLKRFALAALLCGSLGQAQAGNLLLAKEGFGYSPQQAQVVAEGQVCLVGGYLKDDEARTYGSVMLLDVKQNKVLWQKLIEPGEGSVSLDLVDCQASSSGLLLLGNERGRVSGNTWPRLFKLDLQGKKVQKLPFSSDSFSATNAFFQGSGQHEGQTYVFGSAQEVKDTDEFYSTFVGKLDETGKLEIKQIKKGGFKNGGRARLVNKSLFWSGVFHPQKMSSSDLSRDFATAKTQLNGNYVWSARPGVKDALQAVTGINEQGEIYTLSWQGKQSLLTVVDANGKTNPGLEYSGKYCDTDSVFAARDGLLAVRKTCVGAKTGLVWIDATGKGERELGKQAGLVYAFVVDGQWYAVQKEDKLQLLSGSLK